MSDQFDASGSAVAAAIQTAYQILKSYTPNEHHLKSGNDAAKEMLAEAANVAAIAAVILNQTRHAIK